MANSSSSLRKKHTLQSFPISKKCRIIFCLQKDGVFFVGFAPSSSYSTGFPLLIHKLPCLALLLHRLGIFAGKKLHPYRRSVHPHVISFSGTRFFCAVLFWARPICPLFGPVFSQLEALTGHYETSREISTFARGPTIGVHVAWYFQASIHAVNSEKQSSLTMMQDKKHHRYRWFRFSQISPSKANKLTEIQFNQALQISRTKNSSFLAMDELKTTTSSPLLHQGGALHHPLVIH